jgi:hypothetical protein
MQSLFGLPYYQTKLDSTKYNKDEVINTIVENYGIDKVRNNWDCGAHVPSNIHHSNNDYDNERFQEVDYSQLVPLYGEKIKEFLDSLNYKEEIKYRFEVVNYTCMSESSYMKEHAHICEFSAVHYLKFNPEVHPSTCYINPASYTDYIAPVLPKLSQCLDTTDINNTWVCKYVKVPVEEDTFVIMPGIMSHMVPPFENTDELRMTVVINIYFD